MVVLVDDDGLQLFFAAVAELAVLTQEILVLKLVDFILYFLQFEEWLRGLWTDGYSGVVHGIEGLLYILFLDG